MKPLFSDEQITRFHQALGYGISMIMRRLEVDEDGNVSLAPEAGEPEPKSVDLQVETGVTVGTAIPMGGGQEDEEDGDE